MQISKQQDNGTLTVAIAGRIDTATAPELDQFIDANTAGITELILDLKDLTYTSSAGLRVLLKTQKLMNKQGSMKLIHVQSDVMDILDMTGFSDFLAIE